MLKKPDTRKNVDNETMKNNTAKCIRFAAKRLKRMLLKFYGCYYSMLC